MTNNPPSDGEGGLTASVAVARPRFVFELLDEFHRFDCSVTALLLLAALVIAAVVVILRLATARVAWRIMVEYQRRVALRRYVCSEVVQTRCKLVNSVSVVSRGTSYTNIWEFFHPQLDIWIQSMPVGVAGSEECERRTAGKRLEHRGAAY
jgi:hypothetical protein